MEGFGVFAFVISVIACLICTVLWFTFYTLSPLTWHCTQYDTTADRCVVYTHKSLWANS